jgi:hypothetical protein
VRVASALAFGQAAVAALAVLLWMLTLRHLHAASDTLIPMPGAGEEARAAVDEIQADLRYQLIVAGLTLVGMLFFGLALLRPLPWLRGTIWASSILLFVGWGCGIAQSTELETERGSPAFPELQAAFRDLLPPWYPLATGLVVGAVFVLFAALGVALLRTDAAEYYQFGAPRRSATPYTTFRRPDTD